MEPGGSLPCSQEHAVGPYPKPDTFSPQPPTLFPQDPLEYYPPIYIKVFRVVSSLQAFQRK